MEGCPLPTRDLNRSSEFSYRCHGCGRCCHDKRIQTNPYEVLRLARNRGMSTGEFLERYVEAEGPYLRATDDGACVFLAGSGCAVHADRPLACRTYPLGIYVSAEGAETFVELKPHPQSEGEYGRDGTVHEFLHQQDVQPYLDGAARYLALFYRLYEVLHQATPADATVADEAQAALLARDDTGAPAFKQWLDVDRAVAQYCADRGIAVPTGIDEIVTLHVMAIDHWLNNLEGGTA